MKEENVLSGGPRTGVGPGKVGQRCKQSQQQSLAIEVLVRYEEEEGQQAENEQERRLRSQALVSGQPMRRFSRSPTCKRR